MSASAIVKRLSHDQREMLVAHVPGAQPIDYRPDADGRHARRTMNALIRLGVIREDRTGNPKVPKLTLMTEAGREIVADVLAEYAEALMSAGYTGLASPLELRPAPIARKVVALEPA